jgi:hypothetical protein
MEMVLDFSGQVIPIDRDALRAVGFAFHPVKDI